MDFIKKGYFCVNNFENMGIILKIIGKFKKNFWKEQLENLKAYRLKPTSYIYT